MQIEDFNYFLNKTYKTGNGSIVKIIFSKPDEENSTLWVDVVYATNVDDCIDLFIVTPLNDVDVHDKEQLDYYFNEYFAQMEY